MRLFPVLSVALLVGCLPKPAEPSLLEVTPTVMDTALGGAVELVGSGLVPAATLDFDHPSKSVVPAVVVSAYLRNDQGRVDLLEVTWVDAEHVTGRVAAPVAGGAYDVVLVEPKGRELVLPQALTVLDCAEVDCPLADGGMTDSGVVTCTTRNYRDRDLDGFGAGTASNVCGPGWVAVAGDCDDRDALTHPLAPELCNGLDDNCDGQIDEGRCADGGWSAVDEVRGASNDLLVASSFAPGSLWVAGGTKLLVRQGDAGFTEVGASCPPGMVALWAEPGGEVELAGTGRIASQALFGAACTDSRPVPAAPIAITGFVEAGVAQYVGVNRDGQLTRWARGGVVVTTPGNLTSRDEVFDLHGSSPTGLFAVGSTQVGASSNRRLAVWALGADGGWSAESLDAIDQARGVLRAVWVTSASDAVAVGDEGVVLRRTSAGWRTLESDTQVDLTSVRAFSNGRFYVSQADGRVRRWARSQWQTVFRNDAGVRFNDLSGTSEEDLWAVGNDGVIGRGPH